MNASLGVIETYGLTVAIQAADAACKSAAVNIIGYKRVGSGLVAVCFAGEISAVKTAIENGVAAIKQPELIKGKLVIARPEPQAIALLTGLKGKTAQPVAKASAPAQQEPPYVDEAPNPAAQADHKPPRGGKKDRG